MLIILIITDMQIFITIILINKYHWLIIYIMLLLKNKLNTIDITFLQNNCFEKLDITWLFALQNPKLPLYYKRFTTLQVISDLRQYSTTYVSKFSGLRWLLIFASIFKVGYLVVNRLRQLNLFRLPLFKLENLMS